MAHNTHTLAALQSGGCHCAQNGEDHTWVRTSGGFVDAVEEERLQSHQSSSGGQTSHIRRRFQLHRLSLLQCLRYCRRQSSTSPIYLSNQRYFSFLALLDACLELRVFVLVLSICCQVFILLSYSWRLRSTLGQFGYWRM